MAATKNSIMIVEDETINITALMHILSKDYAIYVEKNSRRCADRAKLLQPDLILLDVMMPDLDGFGVIKILKSDPQTKDIPVIFITGKSTPEDEDKGRSLGAADYISKPFSADTVKARVAQQIYPQ
jgi:CheY-like chemotaxis protein